jgi:hypothetical protein
LAAESEFYEEQVVIADGMEDEVEIEINVRNENVGTEDVRGRMAAKSEFHEAEQACVADDTGDEAEIEMLVANEN